LFIQLLQLRISCWGVARSAGRLCRALPGITERRQPACNDKHDRRSAAEQQPASISRPDIHPLSCLVHYVVLTSRFPPKSDAIYMPTSFMLITVQASIKAQSELPNSSCNID